MGLLTFLLLRFTGVSRSEPTIVANRPDYAAYQSKVPAFFPNPNKLWSTLAHSVQKVESDKVPDWLVAAALHPPYGFARHCERPVSSCPELAFRRPHRRKRRWLP